MNQESDRRNKEQNKLLLTYIFDLTKRCSNLEVPLNFRSGLIICRHPNQNIAHAVIHLSWNLKKKKKRKKKNGQGQPYKRVQKRCHYLGVI